MSQKAIAFEVYELNNLGAMEYGFEEQCLGTQKRSKQKQVSQRLDTVTLSTLSTAGEGHGLSREIPHLRDKGMRALR